MLTVVVVDVEIYPNREIIDVRPAPSLAGSGCWTTETAIMDEDACENKLRT